MNPYVYRRQSVKSSVGAGAQSQSSFGLVKQFLTALADANISSVTALAFILFVAVSVGVITQVSYAEISTSQTFAQEVNYQKVVPGKVLGVATYGYNQPVCQKNTANCLNYQLIGYAGSGWQVKVDYMLQNGVVGAVKVNSWAFMDNISGNGSGYIGYDLMPGQTYNFVLYRKYANRLYRLKDISITAPVAPKKEPVACTQDTYMCPDGTSVGRTSPSCGFICSATLPKPAPTPTPSPTPSYGYNFPPLPTTSTFRQVRPDLSVFYVEDDGSMRKTYQSSTIDLAQKLDGQYKGDYDMLMVVPGYDVGNEPPFGGAYPNNANFGNGKKHFAFEQLGGIDTFIPGDVNSQNSFNWVVVHEIAHSWGIHLNNNLMRGLYVDDGTAHWARNVLMPYPLLNGNCEKNWKDNGDGTAGPAVIDNCEMTKVRLDPFLMYMAGFYSKQEASAYKYTVLGKGEEVKSPSKIAGYLTIDDVINGSYNSPGGQKDFKMALVLLTPKGASATQTQLQKLQTLADSIPGWWSKATDNRSTMTLKSTVNQPSAPVDISIALNSAVASPIKVTPGTTSQKIASFIISNNNASDIKFGYIGFKVPNEIKYFQNLQMKVGATAIGAISINPAPGTTIYFAPSAQGLTIPANSKIIVDAYADVLSSASLDNQVIITIDQINGTLVSSGQSIPSGLGLMGQAVSTTGTMSAVKIIAPSGGYAETAKPYTIKWEILDKTVYYVNIDLVSCVQSANGIACSGQEQNIAANVINTGSYVWSASSPKFSSNSGYQIRITPAGKNSGAAISSNFGFLTSFTDPIPVVNNTNTTPSAPIMSLSPSGNIPTATTQQFNFIATDAENDNLTYDIFWGDNTAPSTSMAKSGSPIGVMHTWMKAGSYVIKVYVNDGRGGGSSNGFNVTVADPAVVVTPAFPVISSFTASPSTITAGQSATLSWTVTGAITTILSSGIGTVVGNSRSVSPTATETYTLTARNSIGQIVTKSVTVTVIPVVVPSPITTSNSPIGSFDGEWPSMCQNLIGWAVDGDDVNSPVMVHLYVDYIAGGGFAYAAVLANNMPRPDASPYIAGLYKSAGTIDHGWRYVIPDALKDGKTHTIYAYAVNTIGGGDNPLLSGSPKTIKCGP